MPLRSVRTAAALLAVAALTAGCTASGAAERERSTAQAPVEDATPSVVLTSPSPPAAPAADVAAPRGRAPVAVPAVAPLGALRTPDVMVRTPRTMSRGALAELRALVPEGTALSFRAGTVSLKGAPLPVAGVDPSAFRAFAADQTAKADAVWQAVARGEAVASHAVSKSRALSLGGQVEPGPVGGGAATSLRLGALATTGVPGTDLVVDDATARALGVPADTGLLLSAGEDADPVALAGKVREVVGAGATVDLLSAPKQNPVAFLTGSQAAKAFGAFSYKYFPDGTIEPDAAWVDEHIRTETVPVFGRVTCHKLMLPQLRGALEEIVARGLDDTLETYDGCYVPRFIARNPDNSISLHTWGIAIDMDAATNYRGIKGDMHPEVVNVFKRWGFRWGGDWNYTDPMHFEMGAIIRK